MTVRTEQQTAWLGPGGRPWWVGRLLLSAALWFALSIAGPVLVVMALLAADRAWGWRALVGDADGDVIRDSVAALAQALVIAYAAWRAARREPGDAPNAWLGDRPIRRPLLLMGLIAVDVAYVFGLTALRARGAGPVTTAAAHAWWGDVLLLLLALGIGPLWEELFFRGWLWAGLRAQWPTIRTATFTSLLWLACHLFGGWSQTLTLLPVAILLAVARSATGSIRGSFALHAFNNGASILAARLILLS